VCGARGESFFVMMYSPPLLFFSFLKMGLHGDEKGEDMVGSDRKEKNENGVGRTPPKPIV